MLDCLLRRQEEFCLGQPSKFPTPLRLSMQKTGCAKESISETGSQRTRHDNLPEGHLTCDGFPACSAKNLHLDWVKRL